MPFDYIVAMQELLTRRFVTLQPHFFHFKSNNSKKSALMIKKKIGNQGAQCFAVCTVNYFDRFIALLPVSPSNKTFVTKHKKARQYINHMTNKLLVMWFIY